MYERFELLLEENHVTSYKVAKETGVARSTLTNWKQGNYTPKMEKIQKIANYFHVSAEWLLGYDVPKRQYDYSIQVNEDGETVTLCNIPLSQDKMQHLPNFIQYAINLFETDENLLVEDKTLDNEAKEKIKASLKSSLATITDVYNSL
jgi:transcriptional regulator with XRE-family HTH domain